MKSAFNTPFAVKRGRRAFTLVEVLAALTFMAIVIPVAINGIRVANRVGVAAQRKAFAVRIAERLLNEAVLAGQSSQSVQPDVGSGSAQSGVEQAGPVTYRWSLRNQPWNQTGPSQTGITPSSADQTQFKQSATASLGSGPAGTSPVTMTDLNSLRQVTVDVSFPVQNSTLSVRLSTVMVDLSQ